MRFQRMKHSLLFIGVLAVLGAGLARPAAAQTPDCTRHEVGVSVVVAATEFFADDARAIALLDTLTGAAAERPDAWPVQIALLRERAALRALAFEFDGAIADITRAIELAEANMLPDACLARLYKQRGDHIFLIYEWDRVLEDYDTAISLDSNYAGAYFARGVLYYTQGPRVETIPDLERFIELAPDDPRVPEAQAYIDSIEVELDALGGDDTGAFGPSD